MATVATKNCVRAAPHLLTRTWIITPSYLNYRAGKCTHYMKPLAYRFFTDLIPKNSIKHSLNPYKVSYIPKRMSMNSRRAFHSSSRHAAQSGSSAIPHISLHIAAASSGKGRKYEPEKSTIDYVPDGTNALGLQSSGNLFAKRRARPDSGEDSYFVSTVGRDVNTIALGVCDGVGGWSEQGINPADFSHGLCSYMAEHALNWRAGQSEENLHPRKLIHIGYDATLADNQIRAGGATACVAVADGFGRIRTANLGDSGFVHIRLGAVHHYSTPQTHAFNTPFQMSKTPPEIMTQAAIFGGLPLNDSPDRADVEDNQLQHGDVLVFATDGVWDNLSSQDILTIVSKQMREIHAWERGSNDKSLQISDQLPSHVQSRQASGKSSLQAVIASHIVGEAKVASQDRHRDGPFAKAVQREYPYERWHGGKVDDITALVVIATENQSSDSTRPKAKL